MLGEFPSAVVIFVGRSYRAGREEKPLASFQELLGLRELAGLLEGLTEEREALFALLRVAGFLFDGSDALFDALFFEGDVREADDDLPDLAVDEVWFAGVDPGVTGQNPRPALHADRVLYVLVFEAVHLHSKAMGRDDLGPDAYERRHVLEQALFLEVLPGDVLGVLLLQVYPAVEIPYGIDVQSRGDGV